MSISSYTVVSMVDSRNSAVTLSMPKTTDITNRIITFKDLYGSAVTNTITLVTRSGDTFEDGTFSTIISNNYQSLTFYAGQPGKWITLNSNSSAAAAFPPNLSTILMSSGTITANLVSSYNISTTFGYTSSLTVDSLSFGIANGFINMGDIITTSVSTIQTLTSSLLTTNLQVGIVSSLSYISFPGLQLGYSQSIVAEQSTGTGTQELLLFKGSTNTDRIRLQTTGTIVFEPGVSARVFPSAPSNVTPAMIINASSNVGIGIAAPTVTLDVAGAGRFTVVSTNTISTNQVNSSNICNAGWLSNGGALSNLGGTAYFAATSNTTTLGVAGTATLAALTTTSHSNSGLLCNNGVFSNLGGTAYFGTVIANSFSNGGALSNTGGTAFFGAVIATSLSNAGALSNTGGTAFFGTVIATSLSNAGALSNTGGTGFFASLSNAGALSNTGGTAYFAATSNTTTLGVAGTATLAALTTTSHSNTGLLCNNGTLSNLGGTAYFAATSNTTTLGVAGTATLAGGVITTGLCNIGLLCNNGTLSNLGGTAYFAAICNSGVISNLGGTAYFASTSNTGNLQIGGTTTLAGTTVTTLINSGNFSNSGFISNGGVLSNLGGTAYFAATSNTTTLGVAGTATLAALTTTSHSNSGLLCNNGVFSNLGGTAYFAATSNTGTLQVGGILTALSNIIQNAGTTTLTGLSVNTISTNFISACNISTNSISTTFGFFSTISAGTVYGKHVGDGSLLTNLTVAGVTSILSTQAFYTSSISSSYITSQQGYISSLTVDNLAIGSNYGYVNMGDIVATSLSTIAIQAQTIFTDLITSAGTTLDLSGASINMHTSSIQQYLNFVPCPQPVIQFGSWSAPAAGSDGTNIASPETISITSYGNTNYCIYITGKDSSYYPTYTGVPINSNSFYVYYSNGNSNTGASNVFYWQTMGYYGASAGPVQGGGGGGGHT